MYHQRRPPNILTEHGRRQRSALLEEKYARLLGNPAEDSVRANIPDQIEDRAHIPDQVEDRENIADPIEEETIQEAEVEQDLKPDAPVEIEQPSVEEDLKKVQPVEIDPPRVEQDSPIKPKEKRLMAKPTVVIIGADKGGVGKTTVSRTVLDYFKLHGVEAKAYDTEFPRGVLVRFYPNQSEVINIEDSDDQIKVFDNLSRSAVTVIDVCAGQLSHLISLLADIGLLEMVKEEMVDIFVLHVIGSTIASFEEIEITQKALVGAKHVIVANHVNDAAFFEGIESVAKDALSKSLRIDIPMLDPRATEHVEASNQPFSDFEKDVAKNSFTMRGKVRTWQKAVNAQLDKVKLITG
jgi:hypothetical protein